MAGKRRTGGEYGWRRGVSFGSAGRLGAHAAGFEPAENGYLTYQTAGPTFMLIRPERLVIGSLQLPPRYDVSERTRSWTLRVARYRAPRQRGCRALNLDVLTSVLSPAITFASRTDSTFRWRWQVRGSPQWCALPTPGGVKIVHYSRGYPLREAFDAGAASRFEAGHLLADRQLPGSALRWTGRWLATFDSGRSRNVPVLWVFHGERPKSIEVTTYEYMDFRFPRPFGRISAMPLFGAGEADLRPLARGGLERLGAWCEFWAGAIPKLPDEVDEYYRVERGPGRVEVRAVGRRLDGGRPGLSPIPPFLAAASTTRYPVEIHGRSIAPPGGRDLYTHYGPYRLVRGAELRYTMPLCPYLDKVLSPVRVLGDRRATALTRRLREYFKDPKYTFGGDGTYDPDSLLDILHNLRVLAWAAWSLRDDQRPAAHAAIVRDFGRLFTERSYVYYRERVTHRRFARDPKIFDWCGNVTYDMDWYSGMNLAGLSAGEYFGAIDADTLRRKWQLVRDIAAYFEIFQDWATMVPWTDMRGEILNLDCCRHGIQGMIGLARLAGRLGRGVQSDRAAYIASRYMVFLAAEHALPDLYEKGGVPVQAWGRRPGRMTLGFGGLHERDDPPSKVTSAVKNPYTLSPLNPEHMLFLREFGPVEKLRKYEAELIDEEVPGWKTRPREVYFASRPPGSIERNAGAYHFYMLDPHLFLRMLVLDWPSRKALAGVPARELSGQVIAAALVADAPKVLCPADMHFRGTTWDARRRVLTIRAHVGEDVPLGTAFSDTVATWEVLWPDRPVRIDGPRDATARFRAGRLLLSAPPPPPGRFPPGEMTWRLYYAR